MAALCIDIIRVTLMGCCPNEADALNNNFVSRNILFEFDSINVEIMDSNANYERPDFFGILGHINELKLSEAFMCQCFMQSVSLMK